MTEQEFIKRVKLDYVPDSANWALHCAFSEILIAEGGDDDFAGESNAVVALEFSNRVTLQDIEDYDNEVEEIDIYLRIKPEVLKALGL